MKIQAIDFYSKKPLSERRFQIQIKDRDSSFLSPLTDAQGWFKMDDIFEGEFISTSLDGVPGAWVKAREGIILNVKCHNTEDIADVSESKGE